MNSVRRISEARLKRLETGSEHDPVWVELLAAELRRLRELIAGFYDPRYPEEGANAAAQLEAEARAVRQERER